MDAGSKDKKRVEGRRSFRRPVLRRDGRWHLRGVVAGVGGSCPGGCHRNGWRWGCGEGGS